MARQCPLLEICAKVSGINCKDRNFLDCYFLQDCVRLKLFPSCHKWVGKYWHCEEPWLWTEHRKEMITKYIQEKYLDIKEC